MKPAYVVYDLEFTAWPGSVQRGWSGPGEHREIIQVGAVALAADFSEVAALDVLVRPRVNPVLSDYIVALTGITQAHVDAEGLGLAEALDRLVAMAAPDLPLIANGTDAVVIAENCALAGLPAFAPGRLHNVSGVFRSHLGRDRHTASGDLPSALGLEMVGPAHNAVADARAVAAGLRHLAAMGALGDDWLAGRP
ncbi:MAG: exonuclease domain-containing protein [Actinomycetota bacterium]